MLRVNTVKIDSKGFAYTLVYINSSYGWGSLEYKVDSGANRSTINIEAVKRLGYSVEWIKENGVLLEGNERPLVANNKPIDGCYIITVPEVIIGGQYGKLWRPMVYINNDYQFRLLLGVDIMQYFNWEFDYVKCECSFWRNSREESFLHAREQSIDYFEINS